MNFFGDLTWWLLLGGCTVTAALPSFIRPFRTLPLLAVMLIWTSMMLILWFRFDAIAMLAGLVLSMAGGFLAFFLSVFFSGLDLMAKKRYR